MREKQELIDALKSAILLKEEVLQKQQEDFRKTEKDLNKMKVDLFKVEKDIMPSDHYYYEGKRGRIVGYDVRWGVFPLFSPYKKNGELSSRSIIIWDFSKLSKEQE